jgi:hypothetical protein
MLFIVVLFHLSPFKHFKAFYRYGVGHQHRACFGELPHYDRFVSLVRRLFAPLMVLLHSLGGEQTGTYFADPTKLAVCHNRRIDRHRVFDGLAARGKTSMGWFFGLKLHFVINHKGQLMALRITPGNKADGTLLDQITQHLTGKLYADKGYIGCELFHQLWRRGLHLITSVFREAKSPEHPAQHEELSHAAGRQAPAAPALPHRDRARHPEMRDGTGAFPPQISHERHGAYPGLPRRLRI